jgi:hypothetical protein
MIAHRLSTVRKADHIVVVKDGTNIEEGSPQDLIDRGEFYRRLVHAQYLQTLSDPELPAKLDEESPHFSQMEPLESSISETGTSEETADCASIEVVKRGSFRVLWHLLYEQRALSPLYMLTILGAMGAGCKRSSTAKSVGDLTKIQWRTNSCIRAAKLALCEASSGIPIYRPTAGGCGQFLVTDVLHPGPCSGSLLL